MTRLTWKLTRCWPPLYCQEAHRPCLSKSLCQLPGDEPGSQNACALLSQSRLFEELELTQRCWEVIDAQAEMALRSEGL